MDSALHENSRLTAPRRWSLYAGVYAFGCAALTALLLSDVLGLFADVVGLPPAVGMPLLAAPALVVGALVWWTLVERPDAPTYLRGAAFGLLTALLTGALWTAWFVVVWGLEMLAAGPVRLLVGFVLGAVAVAGVLVGLPITYVRRRNRRAAEPVGVGDSHDR